MTHIALMIKVPSFASDVQSCIYGYRVYHVLKGIIGSVVGISKVLRAANSDNDNTFLNECGGNILKIY